MSANCCFLGGYIANGMDSINYYITQYSYTTVLPHCGLVRQYELLSHLVSLQIVTILNSYLSLPLNKVRYGLWSFCCHSYCFSMSPSCILHGRN